MKNQAGIATIACMESEISLFERLESAKIEGKEEIKMYDIRFTVNVEQLKLQIQDTLPKKQDIEDIT